MLSCLPNSSKKSKICLIIVVILMLNQLLKFLLSSRSNGTRIAVMLPPTSNSNIVFTEKMLPPTSNSNVVFTEKQPRLPSRLLRSALSTPRISSKKKRKTFTNITTSTTFRKTVLIITRGRSGSTFLGKLFEENPKVLYIFEPLKFVIKNRDDEKALKVLHDIYSCKKGDDVFLNAMVQNNYAFLKKSSKLVVPSSKECTNRSSLKKCLQSAIQTTCKQREIIVIKVLSHRLPRGGLWGIKTLLDTHKNLKIIHLIRDPWYVISSMVTAGWFHGQVDFARRVNAVCSTIWKNMEYAQKNATYFSKRYKLVVFSDMVKSQKNIFKTAKELYEFVDMLPVPSRVHEWILENTKGSSEDSKRDRYSTNRNSTEVLNKIIKFSKGRSAIIRKYCHDVLKYLDNFKIAHNM